MADERTIRVHYQTRGFLCGQADQQRVERSDLRADWIRPGTLFSFIKMHNLTDLASHVRRFEHISMYSREIGELAHKNQIQDGYHR